jgi:predicted secreted protein
MRKLPHAFAMLLLFGMTACVGADTLPLTYDRVSFSEKAGEDVENDTLVAILYVQREGRRAQDLANQVNKVVNNALEKLRGVEQIEVQSQAYRTNATYKDGRISGWRVHQSIRLESRDSQLLGDTIGDLQEHLNVQSINYRVSDDARRQHADGLIDTALQRFQKRASNIARALGRSGYRIVRLQVHDGDTPVPAPREMVMASSMARVAAPRIEAGTQRIEVTVSGEIELKD